MCVSGACRWRESSGGFILHDSVRQAIADIFAQVGKDILEVVQTAGNFIKAKLISVLSFKLHQ